MTEANEQKIKIFNHSMYKGSENMKCLKMNLTNNVQNLSAESHETDEKENEGEP